MMKMMIDLTKERKKQSSFFNFFFFNLTKTLKL